MSKKFKMKQLLDVMTKSSQSYRKLLHEVTFLTNIETIKNTRFFLITMFLHMNRILQYMVLRLLFSFMKFFLVWIFP